MTSRLLAPEVRDAPEQARTLKVLGAAQVLSGFGLAAGITVGALLAQDMLGSTSFAGLPALVFTAGSAGAAILIGRVSQGRGRRVGLAAGYAVGGLGGAGVVGAAVVDLPALLFIALFIYGAGSAANLQARYAGADLAAPDRRGRAVAIVLVATTLGAVAGPNLAGATGDVATRWGIPALAGPFLLASAAYLLGAVVLALFLRPDPLLLSRARATERPAVASDDAAGGPADAALATADVDLVTAAALPDPAAPVAGLRTPGLLRSGVGVGAAVMVVTQVVMIAVMTMTPVHMGVHGHAVGAIGVVIGVHVAAMFLPAPLSGWLVDRWGPIPVALAAAGTLVGAGVLAAVAPPASVPLLVVALALLGLGWSLGIVSGTALVTQGAPVADRARVQGEVDFVIAIAGASGGGLSGVVVAQAGYAALSIAGGVLALALIPLILVRRPVSSGVAVLAD